jgi:hypothetical protein
MANADPPNTVLSQTARARTLDLASEPADRRLHLALLTGGKVEYSAQGALLYAVEVGLCRGKLPLALQHRLEQLGQPLQDAACLRFQLLDERLVHFQFVEVVDQVL